MLVLGREEEARRITASIRAPYQAVQGADPNEAVFAVAVGGAAGPDIPELGMRGVPAVAWIASYPDAPLEAYGPLFDWAAEIVFAEVACAEAARRDFPQLQTRRGIHVGTRDLMALGQCAADRLHEADRAALREAAVLDPALLLPPGVVAPEPDGLVNTALLLWSAVGLSPDQGRNRFFRRPCPGFNPQTYAAAHRAACLQRGEHPVALWLRAGRPTGPWSREVVFPGASGRAPIRLAAHGHFYHPGLAPDFARRLGAAATPCDVVLTTDTSGKADQLRDAFSAYPGRVSVRVLPNRGRNLGPFGQILPDLINYDAVGHFHSKQSAAADLAMGDAWREFLWDNLIGPPMLDAAAHVFATRPDAGLLIAEDPHLLGWDANREVAAALAARLGLGELPDYFDFPVGAMFWARPRALRPLLKLGPDDYPAEPVPLDGTVLHALERLIPAIVQSTGASVLGLRAPGTTW